LSAYLPLLYWTKFPQKIEKIQERALWFIYNDSDSSYETLLQHSKLPSLQTRRMRTIALETFKIIHKKSPLFLQDLVTIKNNIYNFRNINTADIPRPRTTKYCKNSFRYEAARLWNTLSSEVRNMFSFDQFKNYISDWCGSGEKCFCTSCKFQAVLSHAWIVSCLSLILFA
jgi:hypothetical protein